MRLEGKTAIITGGAPNPGAAANWWATIDWLAVIQLFTDILLTGILLSGGSRFIDGIVTFYGRPTS